jgi:hypothetical protein
MSTVPTQSLAGDSPEGEEPKAEQYGAFRLDALGVSGADMLEAPKRRVPMQAAVLVALVLVAAGALYAMRRLGMGPLSAVAEPVLVDYNLNKKGESATDHKKLLADLTVSHVDHQVPADQVKKNPFRLPDVLPERPEKTVVEKPKGPTPQEIEAEQRRLLITNTLATLKVHSVLSGTVPVARIGDENVRKGDTLAKLFTVVSIEGRSVTLMVDEQQYIISIDDDVAKRGPVKKAPPRNK